MKHLFYPIRQQENMLRNLEKDCGELWFIVMNISIILLEAWSTGNTGNF